MAGNQKADCRTEKGKSILFLAVSNNLSDGAYLSGEKENTVIPSFTTTTQPLITMMVTTTANITVIKSENVYTMLYKFISVMQQHQK